MGAGLFLIWSTFDTGQPHPSAFSAEGAALTMSSRLAPRAPPRSRLPHSSRFSTSGYHKAQSLCAGHRQPRKLCDRRFPDATAELHLTTGRELFEANFVYFRLSLKESQRRTA
jgi:hypothetical protein